MPPHRKNPQVKPEKSGRPSQPARIIAGSFALVILVGTLLLMLPISSKTGTFTPPLNALFTATTSTCVTGLIVYDTFSHWSYFGQGVILVLIQIGGIGLVTLATFFTMLLRQKIGLNSMVLAQESVNSGSLRNLRSLVRLVIFSTLVVEAAGALLLAARFVPRYGKEGIWISIFTAVSAYCNAGIDIFGREGPFSSLTSFSGDVVVNVTVMLLIIIGGLGFIVFQDILSYRKKRHLMLHTRTVLFVTLTLILAGALVFFIVEYQNPATLGSLSFGEKILAAFFQSVTTRTAGFNTVDLAGMHDPTKLFMCVLMFIGAAPGSTGGGIKVTTFMVLVMTVVGTLRNKTQTTIMRRRVDHMVVYRALAIMALSVCVCIVTACVILVENDVSTIDGIFEAFSAFGTVGLSTGITPTLGIVSKIALILTMFIGRIGSISFMLAITLRLAYHPKRLVLPEGQIIVG
ncbi:MAG: Trk family potassium uptake protein [Clostridiales bacterium]|nr:Trk family potassium uptake protein [Clostridiales bacterium]